MLIPLIITGIGLLGKYKPPRRINAFYGYRTARSMASQEAWDMAHCLYGRIMLRVGPPLTVFVVLAKLLIPLPPEVLSLALLFFSFVALIVPIPVVEKRLKMLEKGKEPNRRCG